MLTKIISGGQTGGRKMDDLDKYIETRKKVSPKFAKNFDKGYEQFKIDSLVKSLQARHSRKSGNPELVDFTGLPLSRE